MDKSLLFAIPNLLALFLYLVLDVMIASVINFVIFFIMILLVTAYVIVPQSEAKEKTIQMKNI